MIQNKQACMERRTNHPRRKKTEMELSPGDYQMGVLRAMETQLGRTTTATTTDTPKEAAKRKIRDMNEHFYGLK